METTCRKRSQKSITRIILVEKETEIYIKHDLVLTLIAKISQISYFLLVRKFVKSG